MPSFMLELLTSAGLGVAANLNPCVLPLYPGFLSYMANKPNVVDRKRFTRIAGFMVLSGVLVFMMIIGAITAGLGLSISGFVSVASPIAFAVLIILGILLLFNVEFTQLYFILPQARVPSLKSPYVSAFAFGFLYGPIVIPCNAPLVFGVFAYSFGATSFISRFLVFLSFGLGLGAPLVLLSLMSATRGSWLIKKFVEYHTIINRVAGTLLIVLGSYELIFVFRIFG